MIVERNGFRFFSIEHGHFRIKTWNPIMIGWFPVINCSIFKSVFYGSNHKRNVFYVNEMVMDHEIRMEWKWMRRREWQIDVVEHR